MSYLTTVTGSYPRKEVQKDTLRKSTVSEEDSFEMIKWAVKEQSELGLDVITDGEGYRENMYWFYQLRLDGIDAINKKHKNFTLGGSTDGVDLSKTHGTKGFGIECAVVNDEIKNLILNGSQGMPVNFSWRNKRGSLVERIFPFEGVLSNIERRYKETESSWSRDNLSKLISLSSCKACAGTRLRKEARNVFI